MTFSHLPADTRAFLTHLDNHGLLAHIRAAASILAERGVATPPTLLDEIAERILEDLGRQPGGLDDVLGFFVAPSDSAPRSRPEGAEHLRAVTNTKIRPQTLAAHANVPLRLVTTEAV